MKAAVNPPRWESSLISEQASKPVVDLLKDYDLLSETEFPSADCLNALSSSLGQCWNGPMFKAQGEFPESEVRYYEEIIGQDFVVPTREESWHDLFNALIWIQFPKTKSLLNKLHMEDIHEYGVHPRTPRRNKITHFDECGVVLAIEEADLVDGNFLLDALAKHRWTTVFISNREIFNSTIHPFIFGHANLEMMLSPFEGLTGKWLAVVVPNGFNSYSDTLKREVLDSALVKRVAELDNFNQADILKPLPLLGVPGWYEAQNAKFYDNASYFRPLGKKGHYTSQLPLTRL